MPSQITIDEILGSGKKSNLSKEKMHSEVERLFMGSGKSRGGFLQWLLAPGRMIQNAVEANAWDYGIHPGVKSKKEEEAMKGKGISGGKKKPKVPRKKSEKMIKRGNMISQLMKQRGLSLGEASKALKKAGY